MNTDYTAKITEIFYSVDEFCKQIEPQFKKKAIGEDGKKRRNRAFKMSDSEIITILILFHLSGLLLSGKLQHGTISLSAMPINRRCGLLFGKVSPPFRLSSIGCPLKRENGRHERWPNVFFKPLRALEHGEFYQFS